MTTDYVSIDCDQHSELERLAMRRARVSVRWLPPGEAGQTTQGVVIDVLTRAGAEYLVLLGPEGNESSIRLDRLLSLSAPGGGLLWRQKNVTSEEPI